MVDNVEILVKAGNGGNGAITFRKEKFAPRGGPDGGDGGRGGDVIILADCNANDLSFFQSKRSFKADNGQPGGSNKKAGKNAAPLIIRVPVGTVVRLAGGEVKALLADLACDGDSVVVAVGGRGGWGNMHFATPSRQAPVKAKPGTAGEEKRLQLELLLRPDIALVGPPNTGKSTLLAGITRARPAIGDYPFTTREPVLGTIETDRDTLVVAELPGLLEGASEGKGLGSSFLRHAGVAKALVFVLAGDSEDPGADYRTVREEVHRFNGDLKGTPHLVAINKMDLPEVAEKKGALRRRFAGFRTPVYFISAATGEGVKELIAAARFAAGEAAKKPVAAPKAEPVILRPTPKRRRPVESEEEEEGEEE